MVAQLQVMLPTLLYVKDAFLKRESSIAGRSGPDSSALLSEAPVPEPSPAAAGSAPRTLDLWPRSELVSVLAVSTIVQCKLPERQFDVSWLTLPPTTGDGEAYDIRAVPRDSLMSYYDEVYDWTRSNTSRTSPHALDDLDDELLEPELDSALDPLADGRPEPKTWLALFFRRDWLPAAVKAARAAAGLPASSGGGGAAASQAPDTWEELLALAAAVEGRDLDGDGQPDHGLCLDTTRACKVWGLLSAVYASMAQTAGQQQGVWFDRATMRPLVHNPAMRAALDMWRQLAGASWPPQHYTTRTSHALGHNVTTADCPPINSHFAGGRCLFTLDWAHSLPFLTAERAPGVAGRLGMALAPGSTRVWEQPAPQHWTSLQPPQPGVPFAQPQSLPLYIQAPLEGYPPKNRTYADVVTSIAAAEGASGGATVGPQDSTSGPDGLQWCVGGSTCAAPFAGPLEPSSLAAALLGPGAPETGAWVNHAPLMSIARMSLFQSAPRIQHSRSADAVFLLLGALWQALPPYGDVHAAYLSAKSGNTSAWYALGFHPADGGQLLGAMGALDSHPPAIEIRTLHTAGYRIALDEAAFAATTHEGELTPSAAAPLLSDLFNKFVFVLGAVPFQKPIQGVYLRTLGYAIPPSPVLSTTTFVFTEESADGWAASHRVVAVAVAVPLTVITVAIVAAVVLVRRYRSRRSLLSGRVLPPKWGPDVTLVATDIQNSTLLWELLPTEVMNACLSVHHGEVRKALEAHGGHEVSTEGDAFLASFHTPWAALSFSLDLQARLLDADWPPLLLATCDGAEAWAEPNAAVVDAMSVVAHSLHPGPHIASGQGQGQGRGATKASWGALPSPPAPPAAHPKASLVPSSFIPRLHLRSGSAQAGATEDASPFPQVFHRSARSLLLHGQSQKSITGAQYGCYASGGQPCFVGRVTPKQSAPFSSTLTSPAGGTATAAAFAVGLGAASPAGPSAGAEAMGSGRRSSTDAAGAEGPEGPAPQVSLVLAQLASSPAGLAHHTVGRGGSGAAVGSSAGGNESASKLPAGLGAGGAPEHVRTALWDCVEGVSVSLPLRSSPPAARRKAQQSCDGFASSAPAAGVGPVAPSRGPPVQRLGSELQGMCRPLPVRTDPVSRFEEEHSSLTETCLFTEELERGFDRATGPSTGPTGPSTGPATGPTTASRTAAPANGGPATGLSATLTSGRISCASDSYQRGYSSQRDSAYAPEATAPSTSAERTVTTPARGSVNAPTPGGRALADTTIPRSPSLAKSLGQAPKGLSQAAAHSVRAGSEAARALPRPSSDRPSQAAELASIDSPDPLPAVLQRSRSADASGLLASPSARALTVFDFHAATARAHAQDGEETSRLTGSGFFTSRGSSNPVRSAIRSSAHSISGMGEEPQRSALEEVLNRLLAAASTGRVHAGNLGAALQRLWEPTEAPMDKYRREPYLCNTALLLSGDTAAIRPLLALRGLRVRIGVHSGVPQDEVVETVRDTRYEYRGACLARTKATCDLAAGGAVLLTETTQAACNAYKTKMRQFGVLHVGPPLSQHQSLQPLSTTHALTTSATFDPSPGRSAHLPLACSPRAHPAHAPCSYAVEVPSGTDLFCAIDARLLPSLLPVFRHGYTPDPRSSSLLAPLGDIVAVFIYVSGVKALRQWHAGVLAEAVALLQRDVQAAAAEAGGYVVAQAEGSAVVVFAQPTTAVAWAVNCQERALELPWPQALLEHEAAAEVRRDGRVVLRGLRLRVGLEGGPAIARVVPRTGRLDYTGRTLNRASRIASKAGQGAVLTSAALWSRVRVTIYGTSDGGAPAVVSPTAAPGVARTSREGVPPAPFLPDVRELVGSSQGHVLLKGVKELVELVQVERLALPLALTDAQLEQLTPERGSAGDKASERGGHGP
ncbi:hypothetical protein HYH03_010919 [Edaphochlamys debaryana]|uniref:Guanylate cyclase domain-containing protein n=1 Tax=Edaphochlamys debaryana TaxID=47281 RepID=A0A835XVW7_9CHLO|nr:hypothetical protein HYH03_010919 [Edaphochlamys debaryana]|eukprot:KAG2490769.1 hypothetical protein HYH03_010919 [Edaphochlamys debaryana]